jgi:RimJ/RimL family protein N-acetyltransferase
MTLAYATERLDIRAWTHGEVDVAFDIYRRWDIAKWLGAEPKAAESVEAVRGTIDRWAARQVGAFGIWAIVPRATGVPVGTVLLVPLQDADARPADEVEVGWALHPDQWGRGYATEAAHGALERAWAAGLPEVYAVVRPGNDASVAVTARLGMTAIGRTKRWYGLELDAFRISCPEV